MKTVHICLVILILLILALPARADVVEIRITAVADDGYVERLSSNYSTMCSGAGTWTTTGWGQLYGPGDYYRGLVFDDYVYGKPVMVFDGTEALSGTITSVTLYIRFTEKQDADQVQDVYIFKYAQDDIRPIDITDYEASAPYELAKKAPADISTTVFTGFDLNTTPLELGKVWSFVLECDWINTLPCFVPPSADPSNPPDEQRYRRYRWATKDFSGEENDTWTPYLEIDYTPSAAVPQLSAGRDDARLDPSSLHLLKGAVR